MPPKRKPSGAAASVDSEPPPATATAVASAAPIRASVRLARVVAPAPRTGVMSTSQSIRAFADDARASLAALDAALGSKAAVALLRRGGALDWADAVIPSADLAVERAMLDAPIGQLAVTGTEGPASGRASPDAGRDASSARPIGLLPAPGEALGDPARASKREASASKTAAREALAAQEAFKSKKSRMSVAAKGKGGDKGGRDSPKGEEEDKERTCGLAKGRRPRRSARVRCWSGGSVRAPLSCCNAHSATTNTSGVACAGVVTTRPVASVGVARSARRRTRRLRPGGILRVAAAWTKAQARGGWESLESKAFSTLFVRRRALACARTRGIAAIPARAGDLLGPQFSKLPRPPAPNNQH